MNKIEDLSQYSLESVKTRQSVTRVTLVLATGLAYGALYIPLYLLLGRWVGIVVILPVALAGWFFGLRAGVWSSLVAILFNGLIWSFNHEIDFNWAFAIWALTNFLVFAIVGSVTGSLHDLRRIKQAQSLGWKGSESAKIGTGLGQIVDIIPDPAYAVDLNGIVVAWNHAMEALIGIPAQTMLGKDTSRLAMLLYSKNRPLLTDFALRFSEDARTFYPDLQRDGTVLTAEEVLSEFKPGGVCFWLRASLLFDQDGEPSGAIQIIKDVTDLHLGRRPAAVAYRRDHSTGLFSRRFFDFEVERLDRNDIYPISLLIVSFTMRGGTPSCDETGSTTNHFYKAIPIIQKNFRIGDFIARSDECEVTVLLPGCDATHALWVTERLRRLLNGRDVLTPKEIEAGHAFSVISATCQEAGLLAETIQQARSLSV
jgi:PAS domain S-box-containing protein